MTLLYKPTTSRSRRRGVVGPLKFAEPGYYKPLHALGDKSEALLVLAEQMAIKSHMNSVDWAAVNRAAAAGDSQGALDALRGEELHSLIEEVKSRVLAFTEIDATRLISGEPLAGWSSRSHCSGIGPPPDGASNPPNSRAAAEPPLGEDVQAVVDEIFIKLFEQFGNVAPSSIPKSAPAMAARPPIGAPRYQWQIDDEIIAKARANPVANTLSFLDRQIVELTPEGKAAVHAALDELAREFPSLQQPNIRVAAPSEGLGNWASNAPVNAYAYYDSGEIVLNRNYFGDTPEAKAKLAEAFAANNGWLVDSSIKGIVTHEVGHHIADATNDNYNKTPFGEVATLNRDAIKRGDELNVISGYTSTNYSEAAAESYAARQAGIYLPKEAQLQVDKMIVRGGGYASDQELARTGWRTQSPAIKELFEKIGPSLPQHFDDIIKKAMADTSGRRAKELLVQLNRFGADQTKTIDNWLKTEDNYARTRARTESMERINEARLKTWHGDHKGGWKEWVVTPDEALCEICAPLSGKTVSLNSNFNTDEGYMQGPPAHPNCRCVLLRVTA